jgi:hypothetical protein
MIRRENRKAQSFRQVSYYVLTEEIERAAISSFFFLKWFCHMTQISQEAKSYGDPDR